MPWYPLSTEPTWQHGARELHVVYSNSAASLAFCITGSEQWALTHGPLISRFQLYKEYAMPTAVQSEELHFISGVCGTDSESCHRHLYPTEHGAWGGGFCVSVSPLPDALLPATWRKRGNWGQISSSSAFGFFWQELRIKLKKRVSSSRMRHWPRAP